MEELLNKLIEKGWKPFNVDCAWTNVEVINKIKDNWYIPEHSKIIFKTETHWHVFDCNIRDLVSKGSGLWQYVCENGMIKEDEDKKEERYMYECEYNTGSHSTTNYLKQNIYTKEYFYKYFIIESALCDEDKLEQFLLDNIKIDE